MSAFIAVAFLENTDHADEFDETIQKILTFLNENVLKLHDNHAKAITAYAFALSKTKRDAATEILDDLQKTSFRASDMVNIFKLKVGSDVLNFLFSLQMYWKDDIATIRVEIASYALMAFVKMGRTNDAVEVMKWLITERQATGGFHTTTDTAIGELKHT